METKSFYESPQTEIVSLRVFMPILGGDPYLPQVSDNQLDAKEQKEFIEEEEPLPVDKNIWEDEEE